MIKRERPECRVAVLVPLYKESLLKSEEFSFRNTLALLSKHDIYVVCPDGLREYVSSLRKYFSCEFKSRFFPDQFFGSIAGYNKLLKSKLFYKSFDDYDYLLIVQTDALVFSDRLLEWCGRDYSYVGAPWFKGFDRPVNPLSFLGVGNGGFSLRKVSDFLRVLSYPRHIPNVMLADAINETEKYSVAKFIKHHLIFSYSFQPLQPQTNEDYFWGALVPQRCEFFSVPEPEDALSFAFEVAPEYLYELNNRELPFGCHAWEKYNLKFWRDALSKRGIELP